MNEYYDAIIVGTGAAGLYCALNLPKRKKILMLTKQGADLSDSFLAQGGMRTILKTPCVQGIMKIIKERSI